MRKLIAACAVLSLAAAPAAVASGTGGKKGSHRAKVYRATIAPVVYGADQAYSGIEGKAHLVDNKRRDKVSIHMRGLTPGTTYAWHVHVIENAPEGTDPCEAGAAQGPVVTDFKYRTLKAKKSGKANSKGKAKTFRADRDDLYYVDVHDPATDAPIACGVLKAKKAKKHKGSSKKDKGSSKRDKGSSKSKGDRGKSRDDRGKSRDDRGAHKGHGPDHD